MSSIWIDLENTPHVPFFKPLEEEFRERGHSVQTTARPRAQTVPLANEYNLDYRMIGPGPPANSFITKSLSLLKRVWNLRQWAGDRDISLAISHGSRSQILTAWLHGIPSITFMDYEFANQMVYQLCETIYYPRALQEQVPEASNIKFYEGLKEDLYVPGELWRESCDSKRDQINVVFRPPASFAHYHEPISDEMKASFLDLFNQQEIPVLVHFYPRENADVERWEKYLKPDEGDFVVLGENVQLLGEWLQWADVMIGGGGSMTREAAVAGIPSYSFFQGEKGAADRELESTGRLIFLEDASDIQGIDLSNSNHYQLREKSVSLEKLVADITDDL